MRMSRLSLRPILVALVLLGFGAAASAQALFTDALPVEEFQARRARVMEQIGDGVAVLAGATEYPAYVKFRQNNQVFYLSGVEVPRAIVVIDGRARRSMLFVAPRDERRERSEGPVLVPGPDAQALTGFDSVMARDAFAQVLARFAEEGRTLYAPFRSETLGAGTAGQAGTHVAASAADPWDGRPSKEAAFVARIKAVAPQLEIRNLDPIVDRLRMIKSPREIALLREATRISGDGLMAGMRAAAPGVYEYQIAAAADYVFGTNNAQGVAYFALVAAGRNAHYPHYHALQSKLEPTDLVLFDYGPDYKYYGADVTRMFPASGTFSPEQRELYTTYLRLYQALMTSIRPKTTPKAIIEDAVKKMDAYLASATITDPKVREAAKRFVEAYRTRPARGLGHFVGMEVHDVGGPYETLEPGMVFTIEPALTIPDDRVYVRLEDMILVTETGYENLSAFVPVEVADIEKLMAEPGIAPPPTRPATTGTSAAR
jgi:Xaa-Pro aminopeptidase